MKRCCCDWECMSKVLAVIGDALKASFDLGKEKSCMMVMHEKLLLCQVHL